MNKLLRLSSLLFSGALLINCGHAVTASSSNPGKSMPAYKAPQYKDATDVSKARKLFQCILKENKRLRWDSCLADRAAKRAKNLAAKNYFGHKDPVSGKNEAWSLIASCHTCRYGGENLTKGIGSAEEMHDLLMASRAHRENILSPKFNLVGIGCYRDICVELFAG